MLCQELKNVEFPHESFLFICAVDAITLTISRRLDYVGAKYTYIPYCNRTKI